MSMGMSVWLLRRLQSRSLERLFLSPKDMYSSASSAPTPLECKNLVNLSTSHALAIVLNAFVNEGA